MKVHHCGRSSCRVGNRTITLDNLRGNYVCNACGGGIVFVAVIENNIVTGHIVTCNQCGEIDEVVHVAAVRKEKIQAIDIINGLPDHLRETITRDQDSISDDDINEAKALLYYTRRYHGN